ncbi:MAG: hypothetical protein JHD28_03370 [Bacteroidia bacterium]|nr:hypothetical protein [Bacteroidia bacterium]
MADLSNLDGDIQKYLNGGFSRNEIVSSLLIKGYSNADITEALSKIPANSYGENSTPSADSSISIKSVLMGIFLVIVIIYKFARATNGNGNMYYIISLIATIVIAVLYFSRKR